MRHHNLPAIPTEQLEALRATPLTVMYPSHGMPVDVPSYGPAVLGVDGRDYEISAALADGLDGPRGDVLGTEEVGYQNSGGSSILLLSAAEKIARRSPFTRHSALQLVHAGGREEVPADALPVNDRAYVYPGTIVAWAHRMARLRLIDPMSYGQMLALAKGVAQEPVDASAQDLALMGLQTGPPYEQGRLFHEFREHRMLARLAETAWRLREGSDSEAGIGFQLGGGHARSFARSLRSNGIAARGGDVGSSYAHRSGEWLIQHWVDNATGQDPSAT